MRLVLVTTLLILGGSCGPNYALSDRCAENDGVYEGSVLLDGTEFSDESGTIFALVGDKRMRSCRVITGLLLLEGHIPHLKDLDNLEEVGGMNVNVDFLPTQVVNEGTSAQQECNILGRFPSLKRIETEIQNVGVGKRCLEYAGFEALEYVGWNFKCGSSPEVGRSLKYVGYTARCGGVPGRLLNLEYVGLLGVGAALLPRLRHAGHLTIIAAGDAPLIDLSSLETVGPIDFPTLVIGTEAGLNIEGNRFVEEIRLPSLTRVDGDVSIRGNGRSDDFQSTLSDDVWTQLRGVEITGRKWVCANMPEATNDPCPYHEWCVDVFGSDSIRCCNFEEWPQCLLAYPNDED